MACRNILVGYDYIIKIADFGLARDISGDAVYTMRTKGVLPIKWIALESLLNGTFTTQSDM